MDPIAHHWQRQIEKCRRLDEPNAAAQIQIDDAAFQVRLSRTVDEVETVGHIKRGEKEDLSSLAPRPSPLAPLPSRLPEVIALAEQVVRCDNTEFADLPSRLLTGTLIVR
ncbi:MAG: hypothetical protein ACREFZ_09840, partial [Acetobacteraceae bacterium]